MIGPHLIDSRSDMFFHPHSTSASSAAETLFMMLFHLDELQAGDGFYNLSGRLEDLVRSSEVAGIMVSDHFIDGFGEF